MENETANTPEEATTQPKATDAPANSNISATETVEIPIGGGS